MSADAKVWSLGWMASISRANGAPVQYKDEAARAAAACGMGGEITRDDPEAGMWLVGLSEEDAKTMETEGYLRRVAGGYEIEVEVY
jgi:hypothetical protein